jgi:hypothetical protein
MSRRWAGPLRCLRRVRATGKHPLESKYRTTLLSIVPRNHFGLKPVIGSGRAWGGGHQLRGNGLPGDRRPSRAGSRTRVHDGLVLGHSVWHRLGVAPWWGSGAVHSRGRFAVEALILPKGGHPQVGGGGGGHAVQSRHAFLKKEGVVRRTSADYRQRCIEGIHREPYRGSQRRHRERQQVEPGQ